jgi:copper chaperone
MNMLHQWWCAYSRTGFSNDQQRVLTMTIKLTWLVVCAVGMAVMLASGCATTDANRTTSAAFTDTEPIETSTASLVVHGMGCPLCANNVDKQLLAVAGVTDVAIDLGSGVVTVQLADAGRPSKAQLARAVRESGFTLVEINTP